MTRHEWAYALTRAWRGFVRHRGIDSAASLTFFAALATFPAMLTLVSMLAIVNDRKGAVIDLLHAIDTVARHSTVSMLAEPLSQLTRIHNTGWALIVGLALTVWSVSAYATAFGRAVNVAYEVPEGRQFWKFRGLMLVLTVPVVVGFSVIVAMLLLSPHVIEAIAPSLGFGSPWVGVWEVARWIVLALAAQLIIAVLYYFTPNVERPRFRWVTGGSLAAFLGWALTTAAFAFYAANISSYERIYGWLGGAIALLLWLYLSNLVLVLGAELDVELVRIRQLRSGIHAEITVDLPLRDTARSDRIARKHAEAEEQARYMRNANAELHEVAEDSDG